jgi:tRNA-specific 2-thiouridylase
MARVVLAMSGGVDSSVAAWLLREQGHEVVGLFMRHGDGQPTGSGSEPAALPLAKQGCCTAADAADARRVAQRLGIAFYALDFEAQFARIIDYFVDEYVAGRTPNPCIVCNTWLKFGKLLEYADGIEAQYVATGHHARIVRGSSGEAALHRAADPAKDQSYSLFGIGRNVLPRILFPVGEHPKHEIRRIAAELGFDVADKPDSQEICFVPEDDYAALVRRRSEQAGTPGEIVTTEGEVVGRHDGLEHFTVGQRKGIRIPFGEPRYVVRLEPETHRVVVGTREELARRELTASGANWLVDLPAEPLACEVKIRYRSEPAPAVVERGGQGRFRVRFAEPALGVAPGQAAVCYRGDRVLGGGWID